MIKVRMGDFDVKWFPLVTEDGAEGLVFCGGGDFLCDG